MSPSVLPAFSATLCLFSATVAFAADWPNWRGPTFDGKAAADAKPPTTWSDSKNIVWKTPIPGEGHATPVIVGNKIFVAKSDTRKETQSILCYDRSTGEPLWSTIVNEGDFYAKIHRQNTHASPTPSWDGERLLIVFPNNDGVQLAALSADGKILWSKSVGDFNPFPRFGYGASPVLHGENVIVVSDFKGGGFIAAFRRSDGREVWRTARPHSLNYTSPIVANVAGKEQLLMSGQSRMDSYDPATGKLNWSVDGGAEVTCGTVVWSDDTVFASGGYPSSETLAVKADGSGKILWRNTDKCYEQSMLYHNGHIYAVTDQGDAICWRATDGEEMWRERIGKGGISASPILVGDIIHSTMENGETTIYKATPESFQLVAKNQLGESTFATPVILGERIYIRGATVRLGRRSEFLACIGVK
ncbi:MAG: PQQ-binding-like beta-propeller repeat protein [Verrucomicrobiota bacterium]